MVAASEGDTNNGFSGINDELMEEFTANKNKDGIVGNCVPLR